MSRKATCADNAEIENFFGIFKQEMYYGEPLLSYQELKKLAGLSPIEFRTLSCQKAI